LQAFHRWEAEEPLTDRSPADIIAYLGTIFDWLPAETYLEDPHPQKQGIQIWERPSRVLTRFCDKH